MKASILLAEDDLSDEAIAKEVGVSRRALAKWKLHPEFAAEVGGRIGQLQAQMLRLAIAKKRKRLAVYDDLWRRSLDVVRLRAERYMGEADTPEEAARRIFQGSATPPEAITGMLVREETVTAGGSTIIKWSYDAAVVREIRALEEQAAKELGQWVEKSEVGGSVSVVQLVDVSAVDV